MIVEMVNGTEINGGNVFFDRSILPYDSCPAINDKDFCNNSIAALWNYFFLWISLSVFFEFSDFMRELR